MGKILCIDDDAGIRDFLALAGAETPDLVLMDLSMPRMTGLEAVRCLRDGDKTHSIPVIAVSVHDSAGDYEEAHEAGCKGFRAKPVDAGLRVQRVAAVLSRRG